MLPPASTLLIDDEEFLVQPLREALEDEGLDLDYARTWAEGMALFEVVGHELVVADYDLQEAHTGLRLLAEIKQLAPSTRLVLISGRIPEGEVADQIEKRSEVDIYLRRTDGDLLDKILQEALEANVRSKGSDWESLGRAHPTASKVDLDSVTKIEDELRTRLGRQ